MITKEQLKEKTSDFASSSKEAAKISFKVHKKLYIAICIIAVIVVAIFGAAKFFTSEFFISRALDSIIPTSITNQSGVSGIPGTFYREDNPAYDPDKYSDGDLQDKYLYMYKYYYLDANGEKQYIDGGVYRYTDANGESQSVMVAVGFLYQAGNNLDKPIKIAKIVGWSLLGIIICVAIYIWYRADKKRQKIEKQKSIQRLNATKKKK